jgi:hypothetical protein
VTASPCRCLCLLHRFFYSCAPKPIKTGARTNTNTCVNAYTHTIKGTRVYTHAFARAHEHTHAHTHTHTQNNTPTTHHISRHLLSRSWYKDRRAKRVNHLPHMGCMLLKLVCHVHLRVNTTHFVWVITNVRENTKGCVTHTSEGKYHSLCVWVNTRKLWKNVQARCFATISASARVIAPTSAFPPTDFCNRTHRSNKKLKALLIRVASTTYWYAFYCFLRLFALRGTCGI